MPENFSNVLSMIHQYSEKPGLYEPGETIFWDDPHISKSMLEAHLDPDHDAASRKSITINKEIEHLVSSGVLKWGDRVLDLGCGPGLYSSRLCQKGMKVTGVDFSERSIDFAIKYAEEKELDINYRCINFFDIDYSEEFDVVMQIYGELCTFSDEKRDRLLAKIYNALKTGGLFIFDVSTRAQRKKTGLKNSWYVNDGGFWRPDRHMVLEQGFDYPEDGVWLDQYIVVDYTDKVSVYRNWFHDYTPQSIGQVLENAGFHIMYMWNDLTGTPYEEGGDWITIVGRKKMSFERMLDKEHAPTKEDIIDYLGKDAEEAWNDIVSFLQYNYNFDPETVFGGKKYGWEIRYRRSGKSLCTLHPEKGAFTVLIVLGKKEVEQALDRLNEFSPYVSNIITGAKQYHDGRWLWLRVLNKGSTDDIKRLLQIKKKPQKKKE